MVELPTEVGKNAIKEESTEEDDEWIMGRVAD